MVRSCQERALDFGKLCSQLFDLAGSNSLLTFPIITDDDTLVSR